MFDRGLGHGLAELFVLHDHDGHRADVIGSVRPVLVSAQQLEVGVPEPFGRQFGEQYLRVPGQEDVRKSQLVVEVVERLEDAGLVPLLKKHRLLHKDRLDLQIREPHHFLIGETGGEQTDETAKRKFVSAMGKKLSGK